MTILVKDFQGQAPEVIAAKQNAEQDEFFINGYGCLDAGKNEKEKAVHPYAP
jgi:hypothetical protein